ncbi:unnamed protein product, partial [Rotaria sp. Silwood2]
KNYESDSNKQAELQYAFKSQHHLIPILIEHGFEVEQPWLRHILESSVTSVINFSESNNTFNDACKELLCVLSQLEDSDDDSIKKASNYLKIYQVCYKQGWNNIPKLLFYIPDILFHYAIDKRQPNNVIKMIHLMYTLNDQLNSNAQAQINGFQQWLTSSDQTNPTNDNIEDEDTNNQPRLLHKSQEHHTQMKSVEV